MNPEGLIAIETLIGKYAEGQFASNGIHPAQAVMIMKSVCSRFMDVYIRNSLYDRIDFGENDKRDGATEKTGTIEDLMEDMENVGFEPAKTEGAGTTENTGS